MNYYVDENQNVFAFETEQEKQRFRPSLTPISEQEAMAIIESQLTPITPAVPSIVTMRQARLALHDAGLLSAVEDAIDALEGNDAIAARIEWDYSSEVHRDRGFVIQIAQLLDLTEEALDALFIRASQF